MTQPPPGPWHHQQGRGSTGAPHPGPSRHGTGASPMGPRPPRKPAWPYAVVFGGGAVLLSLVLVLVYVVSTGREPSANSGVPPAPTATTGPVTPSGEGATDTPPSPTPWSPSSRPSAGGSSPATQAGPRKVLALADHPLLQNPDAGLANRACHLPPWESTPQGAENFFTAARDCLDAAWEPFLRAHDLPFQPPRLHFPSAASFDTQCGTINVGIATAAYYCEGDLYLPYDGLQTAQYGNNPGVYLALFAHEYGHHVQELAGIMDAAWERIYAVGQESAEGREMSRRKELQAQCFSGMFLGAHVDRGGSVTREMYDAAWYDQQTRGDDTSGTRDHGTNANYAKWWRAGAYDNRIVDCNTFAAGSADVA